MSRPSLDIPDSMRSDSPSSPESNSQRRSSLFRKRAQTDILPKSWENYSDGENTATKSSEDTLSISSLTLSENSDISVSKRRIWHFRTLAHCVRAWISLLPKSYFEAEIIYEEIDGEKVLKAGTIDAIINSMTPAESSESKHVREFLLTYRYFSSPQEIVEKLIKRFRQHQDSGTPGHPPIVAIRVINLIRRWLKDFFYDFDDEREVLETLQKFIENDIAKATDPTLNRWVEPLKKIIHEQITAKVISSHPGGLKRAISLPLSPFPQGFQDFEEDEPIVSDDSSQKADFTFINPVDIFRQLTMMEVAYFKNITPTDLYHKMRKQLDKCPNLMKIISQFNNTSFWVSKEICVCQALKQRTIILKRFIHIAQLCYEWKNFNTCLEIVGGLSMSCVQRLRKTWKSLPTKYEVMWKDLQKLMAPTQNYINYRNYLKTVEKPAFPYFGLYLSDVSVIQEKFQTRLTGGLINFTKMRMIAGILIDLQAFQAASTFPFGDNPMVQKFLDEANANLLDEDELYACSKNAESSEDGTLSKNSPKFSLKSPRHKTKQENRSIDKFDFSAPKVVVPPPAQQD